MGPPEGSRYGSAARAAMPALLSALDDPRPRVRAYAAWATEWTLDRARNVDQVPFETRLPVQNAGRQVVVPLIAEVEVAHTTETRAEQIGVLRQVPVADDGPGRPRAR